VLECYIKSCKKYIKPGEIIVTNNHHNDPQEALQDSDVRLEALICRKGRKYQVEESTKEKLFKVLQDHGMPLKNMKNSNNSMEYVDIGESGLQSKVTLKNENSIEV
jgi:predicted AlkP superfamily pyrophosphatase or phosphodiesterase